MHLMLGWCLVDLIMLQKLGDFIIRFCISSIIVTILHPCCVNGESNITSETETTSEAPQAQPTNDTHMPFFFDDVNDTMTMNHIRCSKRTLQTHHYNKFVPPTINRHMMNGSQADCGFEHEVQLAHCSLMVINKLDLLQITQIDEEMGNIKLLMIFRQYWTDKRLLLPTEFENDCPNVLDVNNLTASYDPEDTSSEVFLPDVFIHGIEEVYKPEILMQAQTFGVNEQGRITFTMFGFFTLSCSMSLHNFPMDIQYCPIYLESWRLTEDFQTLVWAKDRPIGIQKAYSLDQFNLGVRVLDIHNVEYTTGNFSQLGVVLIFSRKLQFYILQIYLPTVLFIIISWLTFIIPPSYAQGRIILTITTMLTLAALFSLVGMHSPSTSYLKAIDIWMFVCLLFVFAAVVDCLVDIRLLFVLSQSYKEEKLGFLTPISVALVENRRVFHDFFSNKGRGDEEQGGDSHSGGGGGGGGGGAASSAPSEFFDVTSKPDVTAAGPSGGGARSILRQRSSATEQRAGLGVNFAAEPTHIDDDSDTEPERPASGAANTEERWDHRADVFEKMSLLLYPAAFLLFNLCYWSYYLTASRPPEKLEGPMERGFTPKPIVMHFLDDGQLH